MSKQSVKVQDVHHGLSVQQNAFTGRELLRMFHLAVRRHRNLPMLGKASTPATDDRARLRHKPD
jgi:hypothetical protein